MRGVVGRAAPFHDCDRPMRVTRIKVGAKEDQCHRMKYRRGLVGWAQAEKIAQSIKAFWGDTHGVILPYVTIMLVVIVGVSVLALDGSRYMSLQTQLQNGADALAIAGAAELDRTPTAIERATRAINRLVTNSSLFGSGSDRNVRVARINFLRTLPPRDSDPILPGNRTSDPTLAAFVEVTVEPISLRTILPASIFGVLNVLTAWWHRVAVF